MKKIVPFSNNIKFNTKIYEITSISLEHNLKMQDDENIKGDFVISGNYKMNEISINEEPFIYSLPFEITLDSKYDTNKMKIDVDDFSFEILNEEVLKVNIDVLIDGVELIKPDVIIDEINERKDEEDDLINIFEDDIEIKSEIAPEKEKEKEVTSIFNSIDNMTENYVSYHVHIVRDNDNIESICSLYKVSKDDLFLYNDIKDIMVGDKIIIPFVENEEV